MNIPYRSNLGLIQSCSRCLLDYSKLKTFSFYSNIIQYYYSIQEMHCIKNTQYKTFRINSPSQSVIDLYHMQKNAQFVNSIYPFGRLQQTLLYIGFVNRCKMQACSANNRKQCWVCTEFYLSCMNCMISCNNNVLNGVICAKSCRFRSCFVYVLLSLVLSTYIEVDNVGIL